MQTNWKIDFLWCMSVFITSLNSGSNGNCYYVGNKEEAVLIDAGISCREIEKRMSRLNLDMSFIKAIFISHEHSDHIKGLEVLSRKHNIPVYISDLTYTSSGLNLKDDLRRSFRGNNLISIGKLEVRTFLKLHDAIDPHSFVVSSENIHVGIFTDIGDVCHQLIHHFRQCHAAILEANYDEDLLEDGNYPYYLKKRIQSNLGHLSNAQSFELYEKYKAAHLSHLILAHLSNENNRPELVHELYSNAKKAIKISVASRFQESPMVEIKAEGVEWSIESRSHSVSSQLNLF